MRGKLEACLPADEERVERGASATLSGQDGASYAA
jgi:hypothetical protein